MLHGAATASIRRGSCLENHNHLPAPPYRCPDVPDEGAAFGLPAGRLLVPHYHQVHHLSNCLKERQQLHLRVVLWDVACVASHESCIRAPAVQPVRARTDKDLNSVGLTPRWRLVPVVAVLLEAARQAAHRLRHHRGQRSRPHPGGRRMRTRVSRKEVGRLLQQVQHHRFR